MPLTVWTHLKIPRLGIHPFAKVACEPWVKYQPDGPGYPASNEAEKESP